MSGVTVHEDPKARLAAWPCGGGWSVAARKGGGYGERL